MNEIPFPLEDSFLENPPKIFVNVKYTFEGSVDPKIKKLMDNGGAKQLLYTTISTSYLIVGEGADEMKIAEAEDVYDIPVVRPRWVAFSAKAGKLLPSHGFDVQRNRLFQSVTATSAGIKGEDLKRLWASVTYHGGKFRRSLDKTCTHLIANDCESKKYQQAKQNGIKVVCCDWINECIKGSSLVEETKYDPQFLTTPAEPARNLQPSPAPQTNNIPQAAVHDAVVQQTSKLATTTMAFRLVKAAQVASSSIMARPPAPHTILQVQLPGSQPANNGPQGRGVAICQQTQQQARQQLLLQLKHQQGHQVQVMQGAHHPGGPSGSPLQSNLLIPLLPPQMQNKQFQGIGPTDRKPLQGSQQHYNVVIRQGQQFTQMSHPPPPRQLVAQIRHSGQPGQPGQPVGQVGQKNVPFQPGAPPRQQVLWTQQHHMEILRQIDMDPNLKAKWRQMNPGQQSLLMQKLAARFREDQIRKEKETMLRKQQINQQNATMEQRNHQGQQQVPVPSGGIQQVGGGPHQQQQQQHIRKSSGQPIVVQQQMSPIQGPDKAMPVPQSSPALLMPQSTPSPQLSQSKRPQQLPQGSQEGPVVPGSPASISPTRTPFYGYEPTFKSPPNGFLVGCVFWAAAQIADAPNWKQCILHYGGEVVVGHYNPSRVTHVLCKNQKFPEFQQVLREGKRLVTLHWLSDTCARKVMAPPFYAIHLPVPFNEEHLPLKGQSFAVTGFEGEDREHVIKMLKLLGAHYTSFFTILNKGLVACRTDGDKYLKAREWNLPVVNIQFVNELVLFGNPWSFLLSDSPKYQQYSLEQPFRVDMNIASHLMAAWKTSIRVSNDVVDKFKTRIKRPLGQTEDEDDVVGAKKMKLIEEEGQQMTFLDNLTVPTPMDVDKKPEERDADVKKLGIENRPLPVIMFTGFCEKFKTAATEKVTSLGALVTNDMTEATHVVSWERVTANLYSALCRVKYIVGAPWVRDSCTARGFVDEGGPYVANVPLFEKFHKVRIADVLKKSDRHLLFKGLTFFITPGLFGKLRSGLETIIESGGGQLDKNQSSMRDVKKKAKRNPEKYIIITNFEDFEYFREFFYQNSTKTMSIFTANFIFKSIAEQKVDLQLHRLTKQTKT